MQALFAQGRWEPGSSAHKPQAVVIAVNLLWASLAVGGVKMLMKGTILRILSFPASTAFTFLFFVVVVLVLFGLLFLSVSDGKDWARITLLVISITGAIPQLLNIVEDFSRSTVVGAFSVVQSCFQSYALLLLFTQPGSSWFRKVVPA